jgi:thioredoxin reductase
LPFAGFGEGLETVTRQGRQGDVLLMACSEEMHLATFQQAFLKDGLPASRVEMIDARGVGFAVDDPAVAASQALDLVEPRLEAQPETTSTRERSVLVVGAGPAGLAAAGALADWGHRVLVTDRRPAEGGRAGNRGAVTYLMEEARHRPGIQWRLGEGVVRLRPELDRFRVSLSREGDLEQTFGAVLLAVGTQPATHELQVTGVESFDDLEAWLQGRIEGDEPPGAVSDPGTGEAREEGEARKVPESPEPPGPVALHPPSDRAGSVPAGSTPGAAPAAGPSVALVVDPSSALLRGTRLNPENLGRALDLAARVGRHASRVFLVWPSRGVSELDGRIDRLRRRAGVEVVRGHLVSTSRAGNRFRVIAYDSMLGGRVGFDCDRLCLAAREVAAPGLESLLRPLGVAMDEGGFPEVGDRYTFGVATSVAGVFLASGHAPIDTAEAVKRGLLAARAVHQHLR